jgi:hypothetical protein
MSLANHIRKIIREHVVNKAKTLRDFSKTHGLSHAISMVGSKENYINIAYNGNVMEYFKNEPDEKAYIILTSGFALSSNMFIDDYLVELLNLPERNGDKILGNFKYGKEKSFPTNIEIRLKKVSDTSLYPKLKKQWWKVVGIGGNKGFGYGFIKDENLIGPRYKNQIFKQIIEKHNLDYYSK